MIEEEKTISYFWGAFFSADFDIFYRSVGLCKIASLAEYQLFGEKIEEKIELAWKSRRRFLRKSKKGRPARGEGGKLRRKSPFSFPSAASESTARNVEICEIFEPLRLPSRVASSLRLFLLSLSLPLVFVAESAIFWKLSRKDPRTVMVVLKERRGGELEKFA